MSGARPKVVAAQAVVVGVLLVVVYLTLLRPENQSTLSSVAAPGANPQIARSPAASESRADRRRRRRAAARTNPAPPSGGQTPGAVSAGIPTAAASAPVAGIPGVPGTIPGSPDESPAGDQYGDALALIKARLN